MDENKTKQGVSVKEIESFAKKHRFEVFFSLVFVLACFFSFVMWGLCWAIFAVTIGGVLGALMPPKVGGFSQKVFRFFFKQEHTTQLVLAVVGLILSIFSSPSDLLNCRIAWRKGPA